METTPKSSNGLSDSQVGLQVVAKDSTEGQAVKIAAVLVGIVVPVAAAVLFVVDRIEDKHAQATEHADAAITKHAERPHVGVATQKDLQRIEKRLDRQDEQLKAILSAVQK